jgi:YegS/Rv2252/BmrU family lipid kinase
MLARELPGVETRVTEGVGCGALLARQAAQEGFDLVVSLGGDGTHSDVANGLLTCGPTDIRLGIAHAGTGGDFRRMLAGAGNLKTCLRSIRSAGAHPVDVLRLESDTLPSLLPGAQSGSRYGLNMITVGLGADVVAVKHHNERRFSGYAAAAVDAYRQFSPTPVDLIVDDHCVGSFRAMMVCIANGRYAGGGMKFAPGASLDDGHLDVVVIEHCGFAAALSIGLRLYTGNAVHHKAVHCFRGERVRLEGEPLSVEVDGEPAGVSPVDVEVVPAALRVVGALQPP